MNFLFGAFGTRGDVQPAVVAARALEAAGHRCECFVPPNLAGWVRSFGLTTTAVGLDYAAVIHAASEGRFFDLLKVLRQLRGEIDAQVDAMQAAAGRADVIVGSSVFAAGQLLADLHRVPYRFLALSPFILPSREHPAPFVGHQRLPPWLNALSWRLNERLWAAFLAGPLDARRRALGLPPSRGVWPALLSDAGLLASEPSIFPLPAPLVADPRKTMVQVGALYLDEQTALSPPVEAFLAAGPPPVYVGFGSMGDRRPARTVRAVLDAARAAKTRLLLSRGWAHFALEAPREDVLLIDVEPHAALFPRCAAVVHHGGIGTTHAALRAGVPQLVVPHLLDQHYTAHRIELGGVGLGLPHRSRLEGPSLGAALDRVRAPAMRERAREVSTRLTLDAEARVVAALVG